MQTARKQKSLHETYEDLTDTEKEKLSSVLSSIAPQPKINKSKHTQAMLGHVLGLFLGVKRS